MLCAIFSRKGQGILGIRGFDTSADAKWWHKRIVPFGFLLSLVGLVFTFLSQASIGSYHSILGLTTTFLGMVQALLPFIARWSQKPLFFQAHKLWMGYLAQAFALCACCSGGWLFLIRYQDYSMWIVACVFCLIWYFILLYHNFDRAITISEKETTDPSLEDEMLKAEMEKTKDMIARVSPKKADRK